MLKVSVTKWYQKVGLAVATALASISSFAAPGLPPPSAFEPIISDITDAKAPIAAIAGASLSVFVGLRVWKMVRRAI